MSNWKEKLKSYKTAKDLHSMRRTGKLINQGFSLVEILVAITILAILTFPILSAFASAAKVNQKARVQENCNTVGQLISERCKSLSMDKILADPDGFGFETVVSPTIPAGPLTPEEANEQYVYYLKSYALDEHGELYGGKGDQYYVQVRLDPKAYMEQEETETQPDGSPVPGDTGNEDDKYINSYLMPQFSDVLTDNHMVIRDKIYLHDLYVKNELGVSDLADIYRTADIYVTFTDKKDDGITLNQKTDKEGNLHTVYTQKVTLKISYKSISDTTKSCSFTSDIGSYEIYGDVDDSSYKDVYVFYNPYDIYRNDSSLEKSNDEVGFHINYDNSLKEKKINLYLIEQEVKSTIKKNAKVHLQKSKVSVIENNLGINDLNLSGRTLGIGSKKLVDLYTNITGLSQYQRITEGNPQQQKDIAHQSNAITKKEKVQSMIKYLYDMKVEIYVNGRPEDGDKPYLTLSSTKEN